ncbi:MAG: 30S ribosomal protein S6 [Spirochaetes bacterium]|nr:30S ribosomal protein S6 [Spirochaetota bacterium]
MKKYELVLITKDKDNAEEVIGKVKELLKAGNAKVIKEEKWGSRKLAYPIGKQTQGFYVILNIEIPTSAIKQINKKLLINDNILRHMFIK